MREKQKMRHPDLPDQPIWVFPAAVAQHLASGWEPVDDDPKPAPKPKPPAAPEAPESPGDKPAKSRKPGPPPAPQGADRTDPAVTEE